MSSNRTGIARKFSLFTLAFAIIAAAGLAFAQPTPSDPPAGPVTTSAPLAPVDPTVVPAPQTQPTAETPVPVRLRQLEQRVQALKERAWRAKSRIGMLRETALAGGVGAQATLVHQNKMGASFRLIKLVYQLDGVQVFARTDETAESMYKTKTFDILSGPIAPGSHTVSVIAVYRGHGYGPFKYLSKYTYEAKNTYTFTVEEGKGAVIEASAYEKGATKKMEDRPAIDFKVTQSTGK